MGQGNWVKKDQLSGRSCSLRFTFLCPEDKRHEAFLNVQRALSVNTFGICFPIQYTASALQMPLFTVWASRFNFQQGWQCVYCAAFWQPFCFVIATMRYIWTEELCVYCIQLHKGLGSYVTEKRCLYLLHNTCRCTTYCCVYVCGCQKCKY